MGCFSRISHGRFCVAKYGRLVKVFFRIFHFYFPGVAVGLREGGGVSETHGCHSLGLGLEDLG